jgi:hypothetical protein
MESHKSHTAMIYLMAFDEAAVRQSIHIEMYPGLQGPGKCLFLLMQLKC